MTQATKLTPTKTSGETEETNVIGVTPDEYYQKVIPHAGFLLIKKDPTPEKRGRIHMPSSVRQTQLRWTGTGTIVRKSPLNCAEEHDQYLQDLYKVGDRVGFASSHPLETPVPPQYKFELPVGELEASVMIHVGDLLCLLGEDEKTAAELKKRIKKHHGEG